MVFQGLDARRSGAAWQPFFDASTRARRISTLAFSPRRIVATARVCSGRRPSSSARSASSSATTGRARRRQRFWPGDQGQAGQMLHGYESLWLPAALLARTGAARWPTRCSPRPGTGASRCISTRGSPARRAEAIAAARDTATNPAVLDAFALAIIGARGGPAYPGVRGHEPDEPLARRQAAAIDRAAAALRESRPMAAPTSRRATTSSATGRARSGARTPRGCGGQGGVDPDGLFFVHHGVGSEGWTADGFTRVV